jgi:hypothetical protein
VIPGGEYHIKLVQDFSAGFTLQLLARHFLGNTMTHVHTDLSPFTQTTRELSRRFSIKVGTGSNLRGQSSGGGTIILY